MEEKLKLLGFVHGVMEYTFQVSVQLQAYLNQCMLFAIYVSINLTIRTYSSMSCSLKGWDV